MLFLDWRNLELDGLIEVDIVCSKCKTINKVVTGDIFKISVCPCVRCGNVDIERQHGKIPPNVILQLNNLAEKSSGYTVLGVPIQDFLLDYKHSKLGFEEGLEYITDSQPALGLERIRSFYARHQFQKTLDNDDFPSFEEFVRWSIKKSYRDWKVISLVEGSDVLTKAATWVPGGRSKTVQDSSLQTVITGMSAITKAKKLLQEALATMSSSSDFNANLVVTKLQTFVNDMTACEIEIERNM